MKHEKQKPTVEKCGDDTERYRHPSFGEISVSKSTGQGRELFGSALKHSSMLTVTISTAYLDRRLNRDWIHSDRQVLSFQLSEAQWATFISSSGGKGTPVTFETRPHEDAPIMLCPGIESHETLRETFHRELKERCEGYMQEMAELTEMLRKLEDTGRAGKGSLEEVRKRAQAISAGLPNTMAFIQQQAERSMENTVAAGRIELEAIVADLAQRTGFKALQGSAVSMIEGNAGSPDEGE